jgi:hypothetical protein
MNSITITVKVIDALVCQKRIVSLKYFEDIVESCTNRSDQPDPAKYTSLILINRLLYLEV